MGCSSEQDQHARQGQGRQQAQPAAAAVSKDSGAARQQCRHRSEEATTQPFPAQYCNARQGHQRQEIARQKVGVTQGPVDANRAGTDGVGIGPAGELVGGGIQLTQCQDTAEQPSPQQRGQQSVPPDDLPVQQGAP